MLLPPKHQIWVIEGPEFKEHRGVEGRRLPKKGEPNEKPIGGWDTYEIEIRKVFLKPAS